MKTLTHRRSVRERRFRAASPRPEPDIDDVPEHFAKEEIESRVQNALRESAAGFGNPILTAKISKMAKPKIRYVLARGERKTR